MKLPFILLSATIALTPFTSVLAQDAPQERVSLQVKERMKEKRANIQQRRQDAVETKKERMKARRDHIKSLPPEERRAARQKLKEKRQKIKENGVKHGRKHRKRVQNRLEQADQAE